jgi:predicted transposase YdaD
MCELLDYVENRGIARGEARGEKRGIEIGESRGEKRGIEIGEESTIILNIKNLSETLKLTVDQAMDALKVPEDKRDYYRKAVQ